jgi:hypothetical protein
VEPFPDLEKTTDAELKQLIQELEQEENEISYQRRILHGKIDLLKAELQLRLRSKGEGGLLKQMDLDRLTEILAGKATPPDPE